MLAAANEINVNSLLSNSTPADIFNFQARSLQTQQMLTSDVTWVSILSDCSLSSHKRLHTAFYMHMQSFKSLRKNNFIQSSEGANCQASGAWDIRVKQLVLLHKRCKINESWKTRSPTHFRVHAVRASILQLYTNKSSNLITQSLIGGTKNPIYWISMLQVHTPHSVFCPEQFSPSLQCCFGQQMWLVRGFSVQITHLSPGIYLISQLKPPSSPSNSSFIFFIF